MKAGDSYHSEGPAQGRSPPRIAWLVSCEHASAHVPSRLRQCLSGSSARRDLSSHRGFDIGAAPLARQLARALGAECIEGRVSRLLVDLNRSPHHRQLFSEYSRSLSAEQKRWLLETYYQPHQRRVLERIEAARRSGQLTVHIAVHSFTPALSGAVRRADVGILYDPRRSNEAAFARSFQRCLSQAGELRVRRNYPYRGAADGLPTLLRRRLPSSAYLGLELELNQALLAERPRRLAPLLLQCLQRAPAHAL